MIKAFKILVENAEAAKSEETAKSEDDYEEAISDAVLYVSLNDVPYTLL